MGQDITTGEFTPEDFVRFRQRLDAEMQLLRRWFAEEKFCNDELECGLELEAWLIGSDGFPVPDNSLFLATLDRKWVVPELSKFNFEVNVSPQYISGTGLPDMKSELGATWNRCRSVAEKLEHRILSIGILPTVTDSMLCIDNMSQIPRYSALNEQVLKLRGGQPVVLSIAGRDQLRTEHHDLMLESAATSIQVHLKVPPQKSVRYYNASIIASAFTVAVAANSPLLFGKRLWDDTRITVFEQAVDTLGPKRRVTFGDAYVDDSLLELFEHNALKHRILLPADLQRAPSTMPYVRMHNGTIWNWNRALIGFENDGSPHLRIEHRPMSASPSIADLFADTTFYLCLAHHFATSAVALESLVPFETAHENFYAGARFGLSANISWLDGRTDTIAELLSSGIAQAAFDAGAELGIESNFLRACEETIRGRLETKQNGATWQRRKYSEYHGDVARLLLDYEANQDSGHPVHTWC